jgi:hypothetical protein
MIALMEQAPAPFADPKLLISALALLASGWSAFNSWQSKRIARRALSINEGQEQRRRPQLGIYMADGYRRYLPDKQLFGFFVSVSNPTDINNSVVKAELQVTYVLGADIKAICRVPHSPAFAEIVTDVISNSANVLLLPIRIDAHQTVTGWLVFSLANNIIAGKTIDAHQIILEDSHGASTGTVSESVLVREWQDETPKS